MPWPMVHFSIGFELFNNCPSPAFLLGSIAPDVVLVREQDEADKGKSHLSETGEPASINVLEDFFRECTGLNNNEEYKQFIFGYISHIYADIKWVYRKREISQESYKNLRELLWQEENQIDFDLYGAVSWRNEIFNTITEATTFEIDDIYTTTELNLWRRQLFRWLDNKDNDPQIVPVYLTRFVVEEFIKTTSEELKNLYSKLYLKEDMNIR